MHFYFSCPILSFSTYVSFTRLKSENSHITINAVNPGPVSTEIHRNAPGVLFPLIDAMMQYTFKSPAKGAETSVYAAVSDEVCMYGLWYLHLYT